MSWSAAQAEVVEASGLSAIADLGRLNGVALACRQPALAARLREAMVEFAPKAREAGEAFEQATNAAFLDQGQSGRACPDGRQLAGEIDSGIAGLKARAASR